MSREIQRRVPFLSLLEKNDLVLSGSPTMNTLGTKNVFIIERLHIKRTRPNTNPVEPVELGQRVSS